MTSIELFPEKNFPTLADQSVVRFDGEGNPLKRRLQETPRTEVSSLLIVPRTEKASEEVNKKVRRILPYQEGKHSLGSPNQRRIPGEIVQLPAANMGGSISTKAFEKKYELRESGIHRFVRQKIKEPVGNGLMKVGDFFVKAYGQSYLDRFDMLRLKVSDKNNNYSRGVFPKPIRTPLSFLGTPAMGNIPSLLLNKTLIGQGIIKYRERRRGRVDKMKDWGFAPFRRGATTLSSRLPFHENRYKLVQKMKGVNDWFANGEQYAKSLIDGGMSGVRARSRQKRVLRERRARIKDAE